MLYVVILLYTAGFTPQYNTPTYTPAWTSAYTQADSQAEKHLRQKLWGGRLSVYLAPEVKV